MPNKKKPKTIVVDMKRLEIDELNRRMDGLCETIGKIIEAHNTGRKIKVIDDLGE